MKINDRDLLTTVHLIDKTTVPIDYIVSSCSFAALSLSTLFHDPNRETIILNTDCDTYYTDFFCQSGESDRIIVYFPDEPRLVLLTLKLLSFLIQAHRGPVNVLLLSRLQPSWLYRTLRNLVPERRWLSAVRVIRSRIDTIQILNLIKKTNAFPLLEQLTLEEMQNNGNIMQGLTRRELEVILRLLSGNSMTTQSIKHNLSVKTLYSQKITGLKKLSAQFTSLTKLLPSHEKKRRIAATQKTNSIISEEGNLTEAVQRGLFFQVYQPVTDREMKVKGFEVLSRWYQKGKVLLPSEFLPQIRTVDSWVILTACVIKNAIEKINQFQGKYWFSVNIPVCLAGSPALLRMLSTARKQLSSPELQAKLVLEFSEATDWSKGAKPVEVLRQLNEQNYQVFLDDCFSDDNMLFPVRQVSFSGYKLDMSVVKNFMGNMQDRCLIEGLVYYCHLIGSQCIAKGVDTQEKFTSLKKIGVTAFQGYYLSCPVLGEELDELLTKFNKLQKNS